jgi:hypothetical protein
MERAHDGGMSWYCVIIDDGVPREARAVAFLTALRRAWRSAGRPAEAAAFVNRGSASRLTFLLSPSAATFADDLLRRYGASACPRAPNLSRYAPLPW